MEQLNRIELRGNVGSVKILNAGGTRLARISLATNYVYKNKDGDPVIETTWHNISAWEGKNMPDFESIQRGDKLYVCGRIRAQRYEGTDGMEHTVYEVLGKSMQLIGGSESLQYEANL
ncbi:MAG: single-stranded DNA-binding protein [Bacteroidia bacterium]|nr:single-stranded DNA-binding protein [Bacteroidia bacterium]